EFWLLHLFDNKLEKLDLEPLASCKELVTLFIGGNPFEKLGLEPLKHCPKLTDFGIFSDTLKSIDLTPLKANFKINKVIFSLSPNTEIILKGVDPSELETLPEWIKMFEKHRDNFRYESDNNY
ncbi:MAG: hypothetical protein ACTSYA_07515, partial [Candidatus Kariarchaeaceae archaeon]